MRVGVAWLLSTLSMLVQVPAGPAQGDAEPRESIVDGRCAEDVIFQGRGTGAAGEPLHPAPVPFPGGEQRRTMGLAAEPREWAGAGRCGGLGWQGPAALCEAGG
jgi:hypothetical protein